MILNSCIYNPICDRFLLSCPAECDFYKSKDYFVELPGKKGDELFVPQSGEFCVIDGWSIVAVAIENNTEKARFIPIQEVKKLKEKADRRRNDELFDLE